MTESILNPGPSYRVFAVLSTPEGYPDFTRINSASGWLGTLSEAVEQAVDVIKEIHSEWIEHLDEEKLNRVRQELFTTQRFPLEPEGDEFEPWQVIILGYHP